MSCDVGKATEGLENELWRRCSDGKFREWALLKLQLFRHFTYVTTHSPTIPSLSLRHSSFSNHSVASPTSQFIFEPFLQPFFRFSYVTTIAHSPTFPSPHLVTVHSPTLSSAHSPTFPSFHLRHSSFSNPSITSPTSQLILQPFCHFTYITAHSPTHLSLFLRHRLFTYVTMDENLNDAVMTWLNNQVATWYEGIHKLVPRYDKCLMSKTTMWKGRQRYVPKFVYSVSVLLLKNIFVWRNVLYFIDDLHVFYI